jgi:hypothetical protein
MVFSVFVKYNSAMGLSRLLHLLRCPKDYRASDAM